MARERVGKVKELFIGLQINSVSNGKKVEYTKGPAFLEVNTGGRTPIYQKWAVSAHEDDPHEKTTWIYLETFPGDMNEKSPYKEVGRDTTILFNEANEAVAVGIDNYYDEVLPRLGLLGTNVLLVNANDWAKAYRRDMELDGGHSLRPEEKRKLAEYSRQ